MTKESTKMLICCVVCIVFYVAFVVLAFVVGTAIGKANIHVEQQEIEFICMANKLSHGESLVSDVVTVDLPINHKYKIGEIYSIPVAESSIPGVKSEYTVNYADLSDALFASEIDSTSEKVVLSCAKGVFMIASEVLVLIFVILLIVDKLKEHKNSADS